MLHYVKLDTISICHRSLFLVSIKTFLLVYFISYISFAIAGTQEPWGRWTMDPQLEIRVFKRSVFFGQKGQNQKCLKRTFEKSHMHSGLSNMVLMCSIY